MHDGSITFSTELDNKQLEKDLAGLTKKIEKQEQKIADLSAKRDRVKEKGLFDAGELDAEKAKLKELEDQLAEIRAVSKDRSYSQGVREEVKAQIPGLREELSEQRERVRMLQTEWNKTENAADRYTEQLEREKEVLSRQKEEAGYILQQIEEANQARADTLASAEVSDQHIVDLNRELLDLKERQKELEGAGLGLGHLEYDETVARIAEATRELKEYRKALNDTGSAGQPSMEERLEPVLNNAASIFGRLQEFKDAADQAIGKIVNDMSGLWRAVEKAGSAVKQFSKAAVKAFTQAALSAVKLLDKVNVFPKMFSSISKPLIKLGQMIRRVFVFSVITSGLRMVREQMSAYLGINARFSNALQQLKGVLLTAFQPIYDVVVPALTVLMNALSRAIATITQFTAVLFGTTAKQAQKNAQALYNQAKATSAAGSAAEEASNQLTSFDEINKLQDESSAGGSGAADTGPLFDWEYEDTPFPDWGEAFDAFLDKLLAGIPKLKEAFKSFADWLNDLNRKLYDMFTFPGVLDKVKQLGRELADAFAYLMDEIDWELWGRALGAGLNLALNFLTSFLYEFPWDRLGQHLAEFINGLVDEIDWYEFGRLLWSGFKIGLETLAGLLLGLDMPTLAEAASNIVKGFFNEMKATIDRIQWSEIGAQIARFLNNIDWVGALSSMAAAIAAGINAAVHTLGALISTLDWAGIGYAVADALNLMIADIDWPALGETISNFFKGALAFIYAAVSNFDWNAFGASIGTALASIDWFGILSMIFNIIWEIISGLCEGLLAALKSFWENADPFEKMLLAIAVAVGVVGTAITAFSGIASAASAVIQTLETAVKGVQLVFSALTSPIGLVVAAITAAVAIIITHFDGLRDAAQQAWEGIKEAFGAAAEWISENVVTPIVDGYNEHIKPVLEAFIEKITEVVEEHVVPMVEKAIEFFGKVFDALQDLWDNIIGPLVSWIVETAVPLVGSALEIAGDAFNALLTTVSDVVGGIMDALSGVIDFITGVFTGDWERAWNGVKEVFSGIIEAITGIFEGAINFITRLISNITSAISGLVSSITGIGSAASSAGSRAANLGSARIASPYSMPDIGAFQIPALAQGAVIPPNREFMAVLGDQSHGNNLEAPEDLIRKIVREESGGGNTALLEAILEAIKEGQVINMDGRSVTKGVVKHMNAMTRQSGRSVVLG